MAVTIRPAHAADAQVLAVLGATTFYETFRPFNTEEDMNAYISKAYNEVVVLANLQNPQIKYAIAFDGDTAIGYIKLLLDATHPKLIGKTIELEKIYVLQSYLGTGAGKELMHYALNLARNENALHLFLGVWNENERAVAFYRKAGFEVFDNRSFQLGSRLCEDYMMVYRNLQ
jgi:ribosomal protein S18 acetylase RimI-like enzyme